MAMALDIVDIGPVINVVTQIATIAVTLVSPWLVHRALVYANARLHLEMSNQQMQVVEDEAKVAAGLVMSKVSSKAMGLSQVHIHDPTLRLLASAALDRMYVMVPKLGLTVDDAAARIVAHVFALISADPTVQTVQTPPAQPAQPKDQVQ